MILFLYALFSLLFLGHIVEAHDLTHHRNGRLRRAFHHVQPRTLTSRAVTPPEGWSLYLAPGNDGTGCYVDSSTRVLPTYLGTGYAGVTDCLTACQSRNMSWAGVESSNQCYCSATAPTPVNAPGSSCNYKCPGSTEFCGGSWKIQVYSYKAPTAVSGWTLQGCVSDGSARALTGAAWSSISMTSAKCVSFCAGKGYALAGVENGDQCYCGDSIQNGLGQRLDDGRCAYACKGGGSYCGGGWSMSLFKNPAAAVVLPISSSSSSSITTTTTSSTVASISTTSSSTTAPSASGSAAWSYLGCYSDSSSPRTLSFALGGVTNSVSTCLAACRSRGYSIGGQEYGFECRCGNEINAAAKKVDETKCSSKCPDGSTGCGGNYALSLWTLSANSASSSSSSATITTTSTAAIASNTTVSTGAPTSSVINATSTIITPNATATGYTPTNLIPSSSAQKYVWAHVIVGNTYPYDYAQWVSDINLAIAGGIDGFILNFGRDTWQRDRIADAYKAAAAMGNGFKMMLSLDMAEFTCSDTTYVPLLQTYLNKYLNHPAAAKVNGKSAVTTFSGSDCRFGQSSTNAAWAYLFGSNRNQIYWMPAYNSDPQGLGAFDIDAEVNWGSAWPMDGRDIEMSRDEWFMYNLNPTGKKYVGTISPGFFTHFNYKNWIWRGDNWLYAQRWEQLISMRGSIDQVEITTWNDYGEADHVAPLLGDLPPEAKVWTTPELDHSDVLSMNAFYATAWKTGKYPTITKDQAWVWARPHAAMATAWNDPIGPPTYREYTQDNFYAQVHLTANATVTLCAGSSCTSFPGAPGINRFAQAMVAGSGISVQVVNGGQTTVNLKPSFTFQATTEKYNFNYLIRSS